MASWQIQQVKQRLSEVIQLAKKEGPQEVTYRGEPSVWIISDQEYRALHSNKENIVDFFQRSPCREVEIPFKRSKDLPRKVEL
jgi:antitoxin Phd